jgi:hypothetical protein
MNIEDEFGSLRAEMEAQRRHTSAIQESLDTLLARLGVVDNERQQGALPPLHPTASSSNAGGIPAFDGEENPPPPVARNRLKPGAPPSFDGDRAKGRAFMNSCVLYQSLCAAEFQDDQAKIHWVLSYMKSDRAATFADRTIRYETKYDSPRYGSWDAFQKVFIETFCPENESTHALMRLESDRYFQGKRTVDAYVDEFEDLIDLSGYSDDLAIVLKFRRGLNPVLQDKIAESGRDRPPDNAPDKWYAAARRFDQNRLANEAFHSAGVRRHAATPASAAGFTASAFSRNAAPRPTPVTAPTSAQTPRPPPRPFQQRALPPGVPMDIDAQRARQAPLTCRRCGGPGHFARDCPTGFDVRLLSQDDRDDLLESLLALKDTVPMPAPDDQNGDGLEEEDFVHSSE